jgi:hypothetical protein
MKVALLACSILTFSTIPVLAQQSEQPVRRPPVVQPGDAIRIYTSTCPLNNSRPTAKEQVSLQPPVDYSPCINWATNRVVLELKHTENYNKVITQRINRLQELGGTDVVKQFLDTKGHEFVAALQQQSPEIYQTHLDELKQLFSSYGLALQ